MACASPLHIKNPRYKSNSAWHVYRNQYFSVPCGWCLNCRVDKKNYLCDACDYEYKKYGCGAFVCFTYDSYHLDDCVRLDKNGNQILSISKKDIKKFLYRLRSNIRRCNLNSKYCRSDFKVLYCAEYGDTYQRPHYHFIFLGLDWQVCRKLFYKSWQHGIVDSLPIENGAFEYVCGYLDKQVHGSQASALYDDNNIERPFHSHSINFGSGRFLENIEYIQSHNYTYKAKHNIDRPIPVYYKNKLFGRSKPDIDKMCDVLQSRRVKVDRSKFRLGDVHRYSLKQINEYRHSQALQRERELYKQSLSRGEPAQLSGIYNTLDYSSLISEALNFQNLAPCDNNIIQFNLFGLCDVVGVSSPSKDKIPF